MSHQKPNLPGLICRGFIKKSITWRSKKVMQKKCRSSKFDLSISSGCRRGGFFQVQGSTPSRGSETIFTSAGNLFQIFAAERVPSTKCLTHVRSCSPMEKGKRYRRLQDSNLQSPDQKSGALSIGLQRATHRQALYHSCLTGR